MIAARVRPRRTTRTPRSGDRERDPLAAGMAPAKVTRRAYGKSVIQEKVIVQSSAQATKAESISRITSLASAK